MGLMAEPDMPPYVVLQSTAFSRRDPDQVYGNSPLSITNCGPRRSVSAQCHERRYRIRRRDAVGASINHFRCGTQRATVPPSLAALAIERMSVMFGVIFGKTGIWQRDRTTPRVPDQTTRYLGARLDPRGDVAHHVGVLAARQTHAWEDYQLTEGEERERERMARNERE